MEGSSKNRGIEKLSTLVTCHQWSDSKVTSHGHKAADTCKKLTEEEGREEHTRLTFVTQFYPSSIVTEKNRTFTLKLPT